MNPYNTTLGPKEFLSTSYILMLKKVKRLIEIENYKKKNKLPLPILKEKFEETSKILEALRQLLSMLDYENPDSSILGDVLNDIGIHISKGNIGRDKEEVLHHYEMASIILKSFISNPDE